MSGESVHGTAGASGDRPLDISTDFAGDALIARVAGRLDNGTAEAFDARMRDLVVPPTPALVLDLAGVNYVSSAGLRCLLVLLKQVKALDGALVLAAVHPRVQEILDIAGFTSAFAIAATTDDALARLRP